MRDIILGRPLAFPADNLYRASPHTGVFTAILDNVGEGRIHNTPDGIVLLARKSTGPSLFCLETTGGTRGLLLEQRGCLCLRTVARALLGRPGMPAYYQMV